jgi:D-alanyl-D-alanine carboxypeptidase/D-alanyl-D-alanine-endopeptidase (penicillin-binding protein 4)
MKYILSILFTIQVLFSVNGQNQILKNPGGETSLWALFAYNASTGKVIAETPQRSLTPASVMKLVTSATALELLGPEHRFVTTLKYSGKINYETGVLNGNIYLVGGGDPAFYSEYFKDHYTGLFEKWALLVRKSGISKVNGDIIVDASIIEEEAVPDGWAWSDIGNYYGAGVYGLTYADNLYKLHFRTGKYSGKKALIKRIEPEIRGIEIDNNVIASDINRDLAYVYCSPGSFNQVIRGSVPRNQNDFIVKGAMPSPPVVAAQFFKRALEASGIEIGGSIKLQIVNKATSVYEIARKESPALKDIVEALNVNSNNLYAEHIIREIGRVANGNSSLESGLREVANFWKGKNIFREGFFMTDGSGLSRSNAICTRTLVEIMLFMRKSKNREHYFSSLPVAGRNGTMIYFFKKTALENILSAKTGSMQRVRSLAGVFKNAKGDEIIFAIIANNFSGSSYDMGKKIEPVVLRLFKSE